MNSQLPDDQRSGLENCGYCGGSGKLGSTHIPCPACKGKARIEVLQPPTACPQCGGAGKVGSPIIGQLTPLCTACQGKGWLTP